MKLAAGTLLRVHVAFVVFNDRDTHTLYQDELLLVIVEPCVDCDVPAQLLTQEGGLWFSRADTLEAFCRPEGGRT